MSPTTESVDALTLGRVRKAARRALLGRWMEGPYGRFPRVLDVPTDVLGALMDEIRSEIVNRATAQGLMNRGVG